MPPVQLREISLTFGRSAILEGLNLTVEAGQYVVILGPSGCGKTSLLRLIAGLIRPSSGVVMLDGRDAAGRPPRRRDVALVPQSGGLYPHLSLRKSIELGIRDRLSRQQRATRVLEAARFVDIEPLLDRRPQQLSGGQLRRAALAKAVASGAAIRLLDEPLSAIDANLRFRIERDLRRVHDRRHGVTIHVTHDGPEALRLGDRVGVIEDGRIVQFDTPERVVSRPLSPAVAAALGTSPFVTVDLIRRGNDWVTPSGDVFFGPNDVGTDSITIGFYQQDAVPIGAGVADDPKSYVDHELAVAVRAEKLKWFPPPEGSRKNH